MYLEALVEDGLMAIAWKENTGVIITISQQAHVSGTHSIVRCYCYV